MADYNGFYFILSRRATRVRCRHGVKTCRVTGLKSKSSLESLLSKSKSSRKSSLSMSSQVTSPQIWDSSPSQVSSHVTRVHNSGSIPLKLSKKCQLLH